MDGKDTIVKLLAEIIWIDLPKIGFALVILEFK
jgi:hypothetical protein